MGRAEVAPGHAGACVAPHPPHPPPRLPHARNPRARARLCCGTVRGRAGCRRLPRTAAVVASPPPAAAAAAAGHGAASSRSPSGPGSAWASAALCAGLRRAGRPRLVVAAPVETAVNQLQHPRRALAPLSGRVPLTCNARRAKEAMQAHGRLRPRPFLRVLSAVVGGLGWPCCAPPRVRRRRTEVSTI